MTKKLFSFLAAALAVLILGIACGSDGGGGGGGETSYTVTFLRNSDDPADGPEKVTVIVAAGENLGDKMPNSQFRVTEEGWEAGYMVTGWHTSSDGGDGERLFPTTLIKKNWTVYAQWGYDELQYVNDSGNLIVIAPAITGGGSMHGIYDGEQNNNGSITWSSGGIRWAYPAAAADYDYVEIEYIGKGATESAAEISSNIFKQYDTTADYMPETGNQYPTFTLPNGKIKFKVRDGGGGIAIQIYPTPNSRTMKFTKATFTKGTRFKISFDPNYAGAAPIEDMYVAANFKIGTLPYLERQNNQDFVGWTLENGTVIDETYVVTSALTLKAKWETFTPGTAFNVDFTAAGSAGLTARGTGTTAVVLDEDNGYTFTYGSGSYDASWAYFTITLGTNVRLSAYKEVTIMYRSVSGDTAYKPFALLAAAPLPATLPSDPHNGSLKINSPDSEATTNPDWTELTFTIDKAKAARLTGTIQICIYDHSAAADSGIKTVWEIKDITFVPD
jgi:hypothetical protein